MKPEDFWKPFEVTISSFDDLVGVINKVDGKATPGQTFAWRGQVNAAWPLHSSLYRRVVATKGKVVDERALAREEQKILVRLHRWGLHASADRGRLSVLQQLAILQHYGAPTRLVDITFNAWVGVWFAVEQKWHEAREAYGDRDARLFAFNVTDRLINEHEDRRAWEDDHSRPWKEGRPNEISRKAWSTIAYAWKPSKFDARIAAQNGGFLFGGVPATQQDNGQPYQFPRSTASGDYWSIAQARAACCLAMRPHRFEAKTGAKAKKGEMYTFRIKASAKASIRRRLESMFGYQHSTIYPDYTGFASFGTPELKTRV